MRYLKSGVLVFALMAPWGAGSALAASFDCAKAATSFEKAICSDDKLSQADSDMAAAYKAAMAGLSEAAAGVTKEGQKSWLLYAQRSCTPKGEPTPKPYSSDAKGCLQQTYEQRITALKTVTRVNGLMVYAEQYYSVYPDTQSDSDFNHPASHDVSIAQIDGVNEEAAKINALLDQIYTKDVSGLQPKTQRNSSGDDDDVTISDSSHSITISAVTPGLMSFADDSWMYPHGAAHGSAFAGNLHYLRPAGRWLEAADIFRGEGWQKAIAGLAARDLKKQLEDAYMGEDGALPDLVKDPSRWSFTPDKLTIVFQQYEVGPYSAGQPTVEIPWKSLTKWLTPEAPALLQLNG